MESLPIIAAFYEQIDVYMLVLVRVLAFFIFLPIISGMTIPMLARLTLAVIVAAAIFSSGLVDTAVYSPTMAGFTMAIIMEFLAGLMMGFMVYFVFNAILFAGHIIDFMMGLSMVNMVDPLSQIQVPIVGNLFFMAMMALMVVSGGLALFMETFIASYMVLPIGAAYLFGNAALAEFTLLQLAHFAMLGLRLSFPIVGALTLINVALGVMVKAAPQMNVFVIGMPIKILVGFFLLLTTMVAPLNRIYNWLFDGALFALTEAIWRMAP